METSVLYHAHGFQKLGWHAVGQQLGHGPDMVGHSGRHCWCDRAPAARRPTSPSRLGRVQAVPQAVVWQDQMVVGQGEPQLLFQPGQLFAKPARFARQPPVALAQREVFPFDKAGVDSGARRRGVQSRSNRLGIPKHHPGRHSHHCATLPLLDHLRVEQVGQRLAAALRIAATVPVAGGLVPLAIDMQQSGAVLSQFITGKERDAVIGHLGHPLQQQIGAGLRAFADDEGQDQPPNRRKGDPNLRHPHTSHTRAWH